MELHKTLKKYLKLKGIANSAGVSESRLYRFTAFGAPLTKEEKDGLKKEWQKIKREVDASFKKDK